MVQRIKKPRTSRGLFDGYLTSNEMNFITKAFDFAKRVLEVCIRSLLDLLFPE